MLFYSLHNTQAHKHNHTTLRQTDVSVSLKSLGISTYFPMRVVKLFLYIQPSLYTHKAKVFDRVLFTGNYLNLIH